MESVIGARERAFAGRAEELRALADCRACAAEGRPWLAVVEGGAGIGKTALVRRALGQGPDGLRLCWASCDQAERDLRYGVLGQLLRHLPRETAGLRDLAHGLAGAGSPLAVGRDLLAVVDAAAQAAPVALVIDDVPLADDQSVTALTFLSRQLRSQRVLLVLIARTSTTSATDDEWSRIRQGAERVRRIRLEGLRLEEIADLVRAAGGPALDHSGLSRLREQTGGHPLHMQTLLRQVSARDLADTGRPLPVPASLEASIRRVLAELPPPARSLVLALAVLDTEVPLPLACRLAGTDPALALGPALASGLVNGDPRDPRAPVGIHHQLQRDAIYGSLSPTDRRDLHRRAADLVDRDAAWAHLVAAAAGPNALLVDQLAAEADRHAAEGRPARAATLRLWAADLAPTRDQREHHLLNAATLLVVHERHARFRTLREALEACDPTPRRDALLGFLAGLRGETATGVALLSQAASATDTETGMLAASWLAAVHILRADGPKADAALRPVVDRLPANHTGMALGMQSFAALFTDGPNAGLAVLNGAGLPDEAARISHHDSFLLMYRGTLQTQAGRLRAAADDLTTLITRQDTHPHLALSPTERYALGFARYLQGDWDAALAAADQALAIAEISDHRHGVAPAHAVAAMAHAQRGDTVKAQTHLQACRRHVAPFTELSHIYPAMAQAALAQADGDRQAMARALDPLDPTAHGNIGAWRVIWLPLLLQAHTRATPPTTASDTAGLERARHALELFDALASRAPALTATTHWLHARLATAQGDTRAALAHYHDAHAATEDGEDVPLNRALLHFDHARLLLATRADDPRTRRDAVENLDEAHRRFTALGATPHAGRAADLLAELQVLPPATGRPAAPQQTARPESPDRLAGLTGREHSVADLAVQGLTNQEIARELLISSKTVEYHLGHVYSKLGVAGRRELRRRLGTS